MSICKGYNGMWVCKSECMCRKYTRECIFNIQSKVWIVLCLYECTMKCTSEYIQEWINCVCTSVWAACAKIVNMVCTVVCFCDMMNSLRCTVCYALWFDDTCFDNDDMMYAMVWWHSSMHHDVCFLHAHYMMMMMVGIWWGW